eukprot:2017170-Prymnesium_polylepis.1
MSPAHPSRPRHGNVARNARACGGARRARIRAFRHHCRRHHHEQRPPGGMPREHEAEHSLPTAPGGGRAERTRGKGHPRQPGAQECGTDARRLIVQLCLRRERRIGRVRHRDCACRRYVMDPAAGHSAAVTNPQVAIATTKVGDGRSSVCSARLERRAICSAAGGLAAGVAAARRATSSTLVELYAIVPPAAAAAAAAKNPTGPATSSTTASAAPAAASTAADQRAAPIRRGRR